MSKMHLRLPKSCFSFFLVILFSSSSAALNLRYECNPADKKTLLKIKAEFGNPIALASWNSSTNCCSWKRISCHPSGKVSALSIAGPNFSGPVPSSIGHLRFLSVLTIERANLTGSIPISFSNLINLNLLFIRNTGISGTIPDFLGTLHRLNQLDLFNNHFPGTIPASLFSKYVNDSEPWLFLSRNRLTGQIPPELGNVNFYAIDLSRNQLKGDASFLFGARKSVRRINPSRNELNFNMSRVGFPKLVEELDLSHNNITGSIPQSIAGLKNLQRLDLSYNQLCGKIPSEGRLRVFGWRGYIGNKCLCGAPLPRCPK